MEPGARARTQPAATDAAAAIKPSQPVARYSRTVGCLAARPSRRPCPSASHIYPRPPFPAPPSATQQTCLPAVSLRHTAHRKAWLRAGTRNQQATLHTRHGRIRRLRGLLLRCGAARRARAAPARRLRALLQAAATRQRHLHVQGRHALLQPGVPLRADADRRPPCQAGRQVRWRPEAAVRNGFCSY